MKKIVIPTLLSVIIMTASCQNEPIPTYYMPQEFKDYVDFPVGSYWIYEDSISGDVDTFTIIGRKIEIEISKKEKSTNQKHLFSAS